MASGAPVSCWLLAGPESGRREAFVRDLIEGIAKKDGSPPEYSRYYAGEFAAEQLVGILQNGSLFASRRVVEYRNAELVTAKAALGALEAYIRNPADDAVLILVTEGYSMPKSIESAVGNAGKKIFWELRDSEKPAWIRERLRRDGLSIADSGIDTMLELIENETSALESASLMLAACFQEGRRLEADDIEAALSRTRQEDAFSLFDRMAGAEPGAFSSALDVLDTLLADRQSEPAQILSGLIWSFKKLENIQLAVALGEGLEDVFRKEKVSSKAGQRKFRAAMQRYSAEDCGRVLGAASETEGLLRSGLPASFVRPILHLFIRSAMMLKGRGLILSGWKEQDYYLQD